MVLSPKCLLKEDVAFIEGNGSCNLRPYFFKIARLLHL